jgi:autotransporter-associated beta strand protein
MEFIPNGFSILPYQDLPLFQNNPSTQKTSIMKPKNNPLLHASRVALIAITFSALPAFAGTTWDGGATPDTNINTGANWNTDDLAPALDGTTGVIFQSANNVATLNVPAAFRMTGSGAYTPAVAFGANFTLNTTGGNSLTLYGTNSGSNNPVLRANSGASAVTINAPIKVFATSPVAAPLGSLLIIGVNNATAANTALNITGGISLAAGSTATSYDIRYVGVASMTTQAKARIGGTISGLGTLANIQGGTGIWAGDLIIAGDQASTSTSNIAISSTAPSPATSARLVLGESNADDQTWNNITLNNVMNLAVGGNITANAFSGNIVNTKITGASATGNISFNSGTIGANVVLGGGGTNENDLSIIKKSSGTLTINSTTATYTGATIIEAGTLNISSATALASPITVKASATLVGEGSTSSSLTFDTGTSTLSFDPATGGSLTAGSLVATGATIVASPSGATTIGTPYTVLTRSSGTFSAGDVSAFLAGGRGTMGGAGTNQITYTPTAPASLTWKGNDGTNPSYWDIAATFNWDNSGSDRFFTNDNVTFDNTANSFNVVVQGSSVSPGNMVFNNSLANPYTLSGGGIGGSGSLTKNGAGTLTIGNTLFHTGGIAVNSGILSLGTVNTNTFTGGISIAGGELQFGAASLVGSLNAQPVTMTGGTLARIATTATITNDTQTYAMNANGVAIKVDTNTNTTWRIGGKISGSGNWTKSGPGVLSLGRSSDTSSANDFTGALTVTGGTLDIRHGDSLGTTAGGTSVQDAILLMQNFGQTTGSTIAVAEPLDFSGNAFLTGYNQENKTFTQQYTGPVTVAGSGVLGISTARNSSGAIAPVIEINGSTVTTGAGSVLSFGLRPASYPAGLNAAAQTVNVGSTISGSGSVTAQGETGSVYTLSSPGYSGDTTVNSATLKLNAPNTNNQSSTVSIAATGATLELNFGGTDTVDKLFIGGVQQAAGVYTSSHISGVFTGTGTLTVNSNPPGGFASWMSTNYPGIPDADNDPDDDYDNDGLDNLTEYALGLAPNAANGSPGVLSGNILTFTKGTAAIANGDVNYIIETSTDLGVTDDWTAAVTQNAPNASTTIAYTFTPGTPVKNFARLRAVLIP